MLLFLLFLFWLLPALARTQLPHVHDLTWFTNSDAGAVDSDGAGAQYVDIELAADIR